MIYWKDFAFDDFLGPVLDTDSESRRSIPTETPMNQEDSGYSKLQETGQEQQLARMAGYSSSDYVRNGMEAGREFLSGSRRLREDG